MGLFAGSFAKPDDTTPFPNGHEDIVSVAGTPIGLGTFEPGWRWSNDVRPLVGTDACPVHHTGYVLSGRIHIELPDGAAIDLGPGDLFDAPSGHDGWVVGDEPCVILDWSGKVSDYAKPVRETEEATR
jgi:hypothetical protein